MAPLSLNAVVPTNPAQPASVSTPAGGAVAISAGGRVMEWPPVQALSAFLVFYATSRIAARFGMQWSLPITLALTAGVALCRLFPTRVQAIMAATGTAVVFLWKPNFIYFELPFLGLLWMLRNRALWFFALISLGLLALPKTLHKIFESTPPMWSWWSDMSSAHILLVACVWWAERKRERVGDPSFAAWFALFAGPTNPLNPINFGPLDLWQQLRIDHASVLRSLTLLAAKAAAIFTIDTYAATWLLGNLGYPQLRALGFVPLWGVIGLNYLRLALYLSGTADIVILLLRVFGLPLEHPYRFALLAWNPVELWRRWSIYNRKLLLKTVYYPLGGARKRRYLNVMLTFLASALVLHTGFVGSVYFAVGAAGWRDQSVYFFLQGLAVCACLYMWQRTGKDPGADRELRLSPARIAATVGTQAYSALVHLVVMAPHLGFSERFRLMGRCLGLPFDD